MKKQTMIYRVSYNEAEDAYETYFYVGDKKYPTWSDFKYEATSRCLPAWDEQRQTHSEENDVVSYRLVARIREALSLGYRLEFLDKPTEE